MAYIKFKPLTGLYEFHKELRTNELTADELQFITEKEQVEMAFKSVRDVCILTNKRIILIDHKGLRGLRKKILSVEYNTISTYSLNIRNYDSAIEFTTTSGYIISFNFSKPIPLDSVYIIYRHITNRVID